MARSGILRLMARVLLAMALGFLPGRAFGFLPRTSAGRSALRREAVSMGAVPPGGKVVVVGNGPVMLLAAKRAALEGYDTHVVAAASASRYNELLYSMPFEGETIEGLTLVEQITGDAEPAFDELLATCDALIIAVDGETCLSDGLVDVVLPTTSTAKRVVAMSRNLNGKGMGPFVVASKTAANNEVWACNGEAKKAYQSFEAKIKSKAASLTADVVIARAGTLKGGGCGDVTSEEFSTGTGTAKFGLADAFYKEGNQDIVNWRMLYDIQACGVSLEKGDTVAGPGFTGVFAATSESASAGDTSRIAMAAAMVYALREEKGGYDFSVASADSRVPPSELEWGLLFSKL